MTDYVVATVQDATQHAIEQAEVMRLSLASCLIENGFREHQGHIDAKHSRFLDKVSLY